jgi:O-antigen/teichoic acid export membrane protein
LLARHLGDENFGKLNYVISFLGIFIPFYVFGTEESTIARLVSSNLSVNQILSSSLLVKFMGGVLGFFFVSVMSLALAPDWSLSYILAYALCFFFQVFVSFHHFFLAQEKGYYDAIGKVFVIFIIALIKLYFIYLAKSWEFFLYLSFAEVVVFGLVYIFTFYKYSGVKFHLKLEPKIFKELFFSSLPVFLFLFFDQALVRVDQVMIGGLLSQSELGQYAVASKLVNLWNFIPMVALSTMLPSMVRSLKKSDKSFNELQKSLIGGFFFISVAFGLFVWFLASPLINILYGEEYLQAVYILKVYGWFPLFNYFVLVRSKIFIVKGEMKIAVICSFLTLILNIFFNYYLLQYFGPVGAIYASIASIVLSTLLLAFVNKTVRTTMFQFLKSIYTAPKDFRDFLKAL